MKIPRIYVVGILITLGAGIYSQNITKEDPLNGPKKDYYASGKLMREYILKRGKLQSEITVSEGEFVYSISYDDQCRMTSEQKPGQVILYWYENGNGEKHTSINGVEHK